MSWRAAWAARWHLLRRSLGLRLVLLFVLLAVMLTGIFLGGMQRVLSSGYTEVFRPLLVDYVDRLAAEIGSPPDPARACARSAPTRGHLHRRAQRSLRRGTPPSARTSSRR